MSVLEDPASAYGVFKINRLTSTASEGSLQVAKAWVAKCDSDHTCDKEDQPFEKSEPEDSARTIAPLTLSDSDKVVKPKRLIDLFAFGEASLDVKLVDGLVVDGRYSTLSYCWGTSITGRCTTTGDTLALRESRISYETLPLTVQHAFKMTREFGLRYIWVDALCIVQDSQSDWEDESAKMGMIYSNSYVTIAADWGGDADSGCFNEESEKLSTEELVRTTNILTDGRTSSIYLGINYKTEIRQIESSILTTRAWAYQERLLSSRVLHFTEGQLLWECKKDLLTEDNIPRNCGQ